MYLADKTGYERSAHTGGCGGANGEIQDNQAISTNPAVLAATKTFMEIPVVKEYFGTGYNDDLEESIRENAGLATEYLGANNTDLRVRVIFYGFGSVMTQVVLVGS